MSHVVETSGRLYGLMGEFATAQDLVTASERTYEKGYRDFDAYCPFPLEELSHAVGHHHSRLPLLVLIGGIVGCLAGFGLQYWVNVIEYPMIIAGRPMNSWPAFIPVTFECTILLSALTAVLGLFALCGLPQPYHPVFNVERFSFASRDRYFLCIEATDPLYDDAETRAFLTALGATEVSDVEH